MTSKYFSMRKLAINKVEKKVTHLRKISVTRVIDKNNIWVMLKTQVIR